MKNSKNILLAILLIFTAGSACMKETLEAQYNKQESNIDNYITKNGSTQCTVQTDTPSKIDTVIDRIDSVFTDDSVFVRVDTTFRTDTTFKDSTYTQELRVVRRGGSNRLVFKEGTGEELGANGNISFYYAGYIFKGSMTSLNTSYLFATNHEETAKEAKWELTDADYQLYEINMHDTELIEGLKNGLLGVKTGEECHILFSGKYGYGNDSFGIIPANSALLYEIWVVAVSND